jgi:hypothetical protein
MNDSFPTQAGYEEVLRPEARPLEYAQLDAHQQRAFTRIIGLLTAATATAAQPPPMSNLDRLGGGGRAAVTPGPYLESARSSRNILISGERGTGKTTLMLSLAKALATDFESDATPDKTLPREVADQLAALRHRLVWLETLDMEPIANEANLLGAVLARVEDAVGAHLPSMDEPSETVPLLHPGVAFHNVSRELGRLQTSVALTFGGNLVERAGSLDPDTFAVESRRAERERLGLDRRFAAVLAGLSTALAGASVQLTAPVFVLPVDDVDLNVGDCVPLLRLLRAASPPHLIVVLAADVGLLSTILRLWYQGELARITKTVALTTADSRTAVDLAANALRKHLPPAQRVVLGLIEPSHALALKPLGPDTPSLSQVLGRVNLPPDSAALQVSTSFGLDQVHATPTQRVSSPGWPATPDEDPVLLAKRLAPFSWLQVLRQPWRSLVDLYLGCTVQAEQEKASAPLAHDLADSPLVRLALARAQAGHPGTQADTPGLSVTAWFDERPPAPSGEEIAVRGLRWHGWKAYVESAPLGMAEASSLVGCAELLGDRWEKIEYGPFPSAYMPAVRATQWLVATPEVESWIDWPWVSHSTFWGYERSLAWLAEADGIWKGKPDAQFGSWVAVMTAQLFDAPDAPKPFDRPTRPFSRDWTSLADRLTTLGERDGSPLAIAWLEAVGLLCTPEMGMTSLDAIPALLPSSRIDRVQSLRDERAQRFPPWLRELAKSWLPTSSPAGQDQKTTAAARDKAEKDTVGADNEGGTPKNVEHRARDAPRTSSQRRRSSTTTTHGGKT